jgi:ribosomal-protein-alanine N-acetyltransferase
MSNQPAYILRTERLQLRRFCFDDSEFIISLLNSEGWLKYIGDRNVKTKEQAENYLKNGPLKSYEQNGFGLSMVETRNGKPIGMCGLIKRNYLEHPDIGFAFLPEFSSMGYGYEIASAVLVHARNELNLQTILAITVPNNVKSIGLLEKMGLRFVKSFRTEPGAEELILYST